MIIYEDDNSQYGSYFFMNELSEYEKNEIMKYEYEKEQEDAKNKDYKSVA